MKKREGAVSSDTCNRRQGLRSLSHLRALLTERTDDSHASPALPSLRIIHCFQRTKTVACQALVRFFVSYRIKPHVPLVVCLPANSFEFQPCGRTPQAVCLTGYLRHTRSASPKIQNLKCKVQRVKIINRLDYYLVLFILKFEICHLNFR